MKGKPMHDVLFVRVLFDDIDSSHGFHMESSLDFVPTKKHRFSFGDPLPLKPISITYNVHDHRWRVAVEPLYPKHRVFDPFDFPLTDTEKASYAAALLEEQEWIPANNKTR